jgi:hypothetical protein
MREPVRRSGVVALVAVAAALVSCSGGGGDGKGDPAPGCTHASVPATGPGDPLNYFPSEVGWTWTYRIQSTGGLTATSVTGTQPYGSELASVFTSGSSIELIVERPAGAYVLADLTATPPEDQLYPALVLPYPVAGTPATEQVRCTSLAVGDLDSDGKTDFEDVVATLQVFSALETIQVEAGSFTNLAHAQQIAYVTVRTSAHGSIAVTVTQDDWYAPGVGRVFSAIHASGGGITDSDQMALSSWTTPPAPAKLGLARESLAGPGERVPGLAERALRVARKALELGD